MNTRKSIALLLLGSAVNGSVVQAVFADEPSGNIRLGWREVDVSGDAAKYRQHVDLRDGGRLLEFQLSFNPEASTRFAPDRIGIEATGLGGDPFENVHVAVRKFGQYHFRFNRRRSDYFYEDVLIEPALASTEGSTGGDFHHFEFERIRDDMALEVQFTPRASGSFAFNQYTKRGESTTTADVQREEFEVEQPIDERLQSSTLGYQYRWDRVTVAMEQRHDEYDNEMSWFLPGSSLGSEPIEGPTALDFYFLDQPYKYARDETSLRLSARPGERLSFQLHGAVADLDLDADAAERAQGLDFLGNPFTVDSNGGASIDRQMEIYAFKGDYLLNDRLSLVAALRKQHLDQRGRVDFEAEAGIVDLEIDTTGGELGLELMATDALMVSAGWSGEARKVDVLDQSPELTTDSDTDRHGLYASATYRPSTSLRLSARIESNQLDDPFTAASATDAIRYRFRGSYRFNNGITLVATHNVNDLENDNTGWTARNTTTDLRLTHTGNRFRASVGASWVDLDREVLQTVAGGFRQDLFSIDYRAETSHLNGNLTYTATDALELGGAFRIYRNDGSFKTDRHDASAFVRWRLSSSYDLRLSYRNIDYEEPIESYDANIIELAFGLRW